MKTTQKQNSQMLRRTLLAVISWMLMASVAQVLRAEEIQPLEISPEIPKMYLAEAATEGRNSSKVATPEQSSHAFGLRIIPLFGYMASADSNQYLLNKFSAGLVAEVPLSSNVSIEGVFRYAMYNIRPDIGFMSSVSAMWANAYGGGSGTALGDMRQIVLGANLKYELFPAAILTPFFGGGFSYFNNEYITRNIVQISMPQSIYGASVLGGMKLKLSQSVALVGRVEAGSLLNNRNGNTYGWPSDANISALPDFRSYDKYWTMMAGISFGI